MGEAARNLTVQRTGGAGADRPPSHRLVAARWLTSGVVHVVGAWAVSRAIAIGAVTLGGSPNIDNLTYAWLNGWDGAWYKTIARDGYSDLPNEFGQTTWPFFPLLPLLWRGLFALGVPLQAGSVVISAVAFLVALAGLWVLTTRWFSRRVAVGAVWTLCLFPTSITFAMGYPSALFLAGSVWAFVFVGDRRDLAAGLCAAVAVLARPNGFTVAIALVVAVWARTRDDDRGETTAPPPARTIVSVAGPAVGVLGVWCALLWRWAGDPLAFLSAKAGWDEITIIEFLAEPSWRGPARAAWPHVVMAVSAIVAVALGWRWLRAEWRVLALLSLLPPLFTGIIGWGRYAADCFPVFLSSGLLLARLPRWVTILVLMVGAYGLARFGYMVARYRFTP